MEAWADLGIPIPNPETRKRHSFFMDSSRRTLLLRGAQLMAAAAAGRPLFAGNLEQFAQSAVPDSMAGMYVRPRAASNAMGCQLWAPTTEGNTSLA